MRAWGRVGLVLVAALVSWPAASAGRSEGASARLAVLGFQSEESSPARIDRSANSLTLVGIDGVNLTGPGEVSSPDQAARRQLAQSHADHLPAVLLIGNWSTRINDFSEQLAHQTLGNRGAVDEAARAMAHYVRQGGWDGVSVDLESLAPRDRAGLSQFVSDLRTDLPAADSLSVCITAFTSQADYRANGYDLGKLSSSADQIVLMTYDDHGPWENTPGPIGPLRWQRASVRAIEQVFPARRIFLGAANYGYAWRPHSNDNLTVAQARALVARWHARARWVPGAGEWTAKLHDGSTLWWSDARSLRLRLRLAHSLGVYGLAIWSLGSGDPIPHDSSA
jgi:spore germination protein